MVTKLIWLFECRSCYFLFICCYLSDSFFSYYVNYRFQLFSIKIPTFIPSSIISSSFFSFSSSELPATPFFYCASYAQGSLIFLTGEMMTFLSKLLIKLSSLLLYVLDSGMTSSCNSLLPPNTCFKTCFLSKHKILSTWSF